jgi:hypothetical protein
MTQNYMELLRIQYITHIMILLNRKVTSSFLDPNINCYVYIKSTVSAIITVNEILRSVSTDSVYLPIDRFVKTSDQVQGLNDLICLEFSCMYMKMCGSAVRFQSSM